MRELLKAPDMDERKRKTPRPNLNRCKLCRGLTEYLKSMPDMDLKGPVCSTCEERVRRQRELGRVCVHARAKGECRKKACLVEHVMES
jgi:hypothetical protein